RAGGGGGRGGEGAGAVRATAKGRGRVRRPGVGVDGERAAWGVEGDRIRRAEAEARGWLGEEHGVAASGDGRPRRELLDRVGPVVVHAAPAGEVDAGRAGVVNLDPVAGQVAVRLDLVDDEGRAAVVGSAAGRRRGRRHRATAVRAAAVGGGG